MYVAVKGGEKAIAAAHQLQENRRRGDRALPELSVAQIEQQLNLAVDRVMTEGGIADRELAALALKQASGDNVEAIFLLRAYRTTLQRLAVSEPVDTASMRLEQSLADSREAPLSGALDDLHALVVYAGEHPGMQQRTLIGCEYRMPGLSLLANPDDAWRTPTP